MDNRSITSVENGKLGGRPLSKATIAKQKMKDRLTLAVEKDFKKIYEPQIDKAKNGDTTAFKELMDRAGIVKEENKTPNVTLNQVNIGDIKKEYE